MVQSVGAIKSFRILIIGLLSLLACACSSMQSKISESIEQSLSNRGLQRELAAADNAYKTGDLELARQDYLLVLEKEAENEIALYRLGNVAFKNKNYEEAIDYYRATIKVNPNHSRAHHNLSVALLVDAKKHLQAYLILMDPAKHKDYILRIIDEIDQFAKGQKQ